MRIWIVVFFMACKADSPGLKVALGDNVGTLDPANAYDTISGSVVYQGHEQLYEYHHLKRPYALKPLLAEGMPRKKGLVYTVKIKKNVRYHDDPAFKKPRYLKAQDFVTQIKRLAYIPTRSNGWWIFDGRIRGLNRWRELVQSDFSKFGLEVEGLKAPDDHTLRLELTKAYPQLAYVLAMSFTSPVPLELVRRYQNRLGDRLVGTGPFKLKKWVKSSRVEMERNRDYHADPPFLEGIEFKIMRESQPRWLNFLKKKIDLVGLPKDNFSSAIENGRLKKAFRDKGVKLAVYSTLTYWWLSFNMRDPLWGRNKNLRLAVAHAIDGKKYIETFTNNTAVPANSIYPPGVFGHEESAPPHPHDLAKAREYLKKAGYPNGGLKLKFDTRGADSDARQRAEFIRSQLARIGIDVEISTNTFSAFLTKARNGHLQFWQDGWAMDYPDAENSLQLLASANHPPGPNASYYHNPAFDRLFGRLKVLADGPEKLRLMRRMQEMVRRDLPWIMQFYSRRYILYHGYLENYRPDDLVFNHYKYVKRL